MFAKNTFDSALGCLLGALVGDAAGATLEFIHRKPSSGEVLNAMKMPGGGVIEVAPGQITDDGELTLCLAQALSNSTDFDIEMIARKYADWIESRPFDIGGTIRQSIGCFLDSAWKDVCLTEGYAEAMTQVAYSHCMDSKANGSLMRATPLGIWGNRLNANDLALLARTDSRLSHPNKPCCSAVACYVIAIAHLINNQGERRQAFSKAKDWADSESAAEVCEWLQDAENNVDIPYRPQIGFIKIAFTHAFRHLLIGSNYVEAIGETLAGGGDTDTNACIVGGLIGAACGADAIPDDMKQPVLGCDTRAGKHPRPDWLHASQTPLLVERLLANAPA
jgi:ADP-ribosyl-[dinitrogen reductase] hydrolase